MGCLSCPTSLQAVYLYMELRGYIQENQKALLYAQNMF